MIQDKIKLDRNLYKCLVQFQNEIELIGENPIYRDFDIQKKLYLIGREDVYSITQNIILGKHFDKRADSGSIKFGTVTNATPGSSAHNFGMAIDCQNAEKMCRKFNEYIGFEYFETGASWGDYNHIQVKGFTIPLYSFRWSCFFSSDGYSALKLLGGLTDD